jgi:hypothetical protein
LPAHRQLRHAETLPVTAQRRPAGGRRPFGFICRWGVAAAPRQRPQRPDSVAARTVRSSQAQRGRRSGPAMLQQTPPGNRDAGTVPGVGGGSVGVVQCRAGFGAVTVGGRFPGQTLLWLSALVRSAPLLRFHDGASNDAR